MFCRLFSLIALVSLFSFGAYAQSMNIQMSPGGMSADMQTQPPPPPPPPQHHHHHHHHAPAHTVVHHVPVELGMPAADFFALKKAIKAEDFEQQQLDVLQSAARRSQFTVAQVGQLIELFSFSSGKVKVVQITHSRIVDRENLYQLYSHFTFDSDKEKVKPFLK